MTKEELDQALAQIRVAVWRLDVPAPLDWQYVIWVVEEEPEE